MDASLIDRAPEAAPAAVSPRADRTYVLWFLGVLLGLLALPAAFMLSLDPFSVFGTRVLFPERFPRAERLQINGDRTVKALHLARLQPRLLLVGTSRTGNGYDPDDPVFAGRGAFNAGLAGSALLEQIAVLRFALARGLPLERVLWTLDFEVHLHPTGIQGDFPQSGFNRRSLASGALQYLYAQQILEAGWGAARRLVSGERIVPAFFSNGRYPIYPLPPEASWNSALKEMELSIGFLSGASLLRDEAGAALRAAQLVAVLAELKARGVAVDLALSPTHAWRLEQFERLGLGPAYDDWKRGLTALTAEVERRPGTGRVRLLDFGVVAPATGEPVPRTARDPARVHFQESSHFFPALGARVARIAFGEERPEADTGFGAVLGPAMIEDHLAGARARFEAWRRARPEEVAAVAATVAATPAARQGVFAPR